MWRTSENAVTHELQLRRITLPRTPLNKAKQKGPEQIRPGPPGAVRCTLVRSPLPLLSDGISKRRTQGSVHLWIRDKAGVLIDVEVSRNAMERAVGFLVEPCDVQQVPPTGQHNPEPVAVEGRNRAVLVTRGSVIVHPRVVVEDPYGRFLAGGGKAQRTLFMLRDEAPDEQPVGIPADALPVNSLRQVDRAVAGA